MQEQMVAAIARGSRDNPVDLDLDLEDEAITIDDSDGDARDSDLEFQSSDGDYQSVRKHSRISSPDEPRRRREPLRVNDLDIPAAPLYIPDEFVQIWDLDGPGKHLHASYYG
jgi:hypothetical protein